MDAWLYFWSALDKKYSKYGKYGKPNGIANIKQHTKAPAMIS